MFFLIADDNSDRRTTPVVNYVLILANILVFVFLQGLREQMKFTYAFLHRSRRSFLGKDIVTCDRIAVQQGAGQLRDAGAAADADSGLPHSDHVDVHARRSRAHLRQHAFPLDLWRQHRRSSGPLSISHLLSCLRRARRSGHSFPTAAFAGGDEASLLVPSLGASGAISGVLGAYILLFPMRRASGAYSMAAITQSAGLHRRSDFGLCSS